MSISRNCCPIFACLNCKPTSLSCHVCKKTCNYTWRKTHVKQAKDKVNTDRGFGFATYASMAIAEKAVQQLHGHQFPGSGPPAGREMIQNLGFITSFLPVLVFLSKNQSTSGTFFKFCGINCNADFCILNLKRWTHDAQGRFRHADGVCLNGKIFWELIFARVVMSERETYWAKPEVWTPVTRQDGAWEANVSRHSL